VGAERSGEEGKPRRRSSFDLRVTQGRVLRGGSFKLELTNNNVHATLEDCHSLFTATAWCALTGDIDTRSR
jgi:hypothetical protein